MMITILDDANLDSLKLKTKDYFSGINNGQKVKNKDSTSEADQFSVQLIIDNNLLMREVFKFNKM